MRDAAGHWGDFRVDRAHCQRMAPYGRLRHVVDSAAQATAGHGRSAARPVSVRAVGPKLWNAAVTGDYQRGRSCVPSRARARQCVVHHGEDRQRQRSGTKVIAVGQYRILSNRRPRPQFSIQTGRLGAFAQWCKGTSAGRQSGAAGRLVAGRYPLAPHTWLAVGCQVCRDGDWHERGYSLQSADSCAQRRCWFVLAFRRGLGSAGAALDPIRSAVVRHAGTDTMLCAYFAGIRPKEYLLTMLITAFRSPPSARSDGFASDRGRWAPCAKQCAAVEDPDWFEVLDGFPPKSLAGAAFRVGWT